MRYEVPVTSKGQITIPKKIRDKLGLKEGDAVAFVPTDHGVFIIPRNKPVESIFGILSEYAIADTTVEDYDEAARDAVSDHVVGNHGRQKDDAA